MHIKEEALVINRLFVGLTRPPMLLGVTLNYLGIGGLIALSGFVLFSSPWCLLSYIPLHLFGVAACAIDPNIFSLFFCNLNCLNVPNRFIWGCQSYEPY